MKRAGPVLSKGGQFSGLPSAVSESRPLCPRRAVMLSLSWRVVRIVSHNETTGEIIATVESPDPAKKTTAPLKLWAHSAGGFRVGEVLDCVGDFAMHPRFGRVFKAERHERRMPVSTADAVEYLATNVKKLDKSLAEEILLEVGGIDAFLALMRGPQKSTLYDLACLQQKRRIVRSIASVDWASTEIDPELLARLKGAGIKLGRMRKIVRHFGNSGARTVIATTPYHLCEVPGVGFASAEAVAAYEAKRRGQPFDPRDPDRLMYGLVWVLGQQRSHGHVCLEPEPTYRAVVRTLRLAELRRLDPIPEDLTAALTQAKTRGVERKLLVEEFGALYSVSMWRAERDVADNLRRLLLRPASLAPAQRALVVRRLAQTRLSEEQQAAVVRALEERITCITGGPGVGKTSTVGELVKEIKNLGMSLLLAAPTGKAAKRMTEVTQEPASTLHRLLDLKGSPEQNDDEDHRNQRPTRPDFLRADVLIVDECSMIDILVFRELLVRIKSGTTRLVLIGDENQLPPVGPGEPFRDLLHAGHVAVARLTKVFRQVGDRTDGGGIIAGAYRLNGGKLPEFDASGTDVRLYDPSQVKTYATLPQAKRDAWVGDKILAWLVDAHRVYAAQLGLNPVKDMQVLTPMNDGPLGVVTINQRLQQAFNPGHQVNALDASLRIGSGTARYYARAGDKVIQLKNDYNRDVANGQVGYVTRVDLSAEALFVRFDGGEEEVEYRAGEQCAQLALAYCFSIHRSQGSEAPVVFLVVDDMHGPMLYRQLVYTGWTRAKRAVAVYGRKSGLERAARETMLGKRVGHLPERFAAALQRTGMRRRPDATLLSASSA